MGDLHQVGLRPQNLVARNHLVALLPAWGLLWSFQGAVVLPFPGPKVVVLLVWPVFGWGTGQWWCPVFTERFSQWWAGSVAWGTGVAGNAISTALAPAWAESDSFPGGVSLWLKQAGARRGGPGQRSVERARFRRRRLLPSVVVGGFRSATLGGRPPGWGLP